MGGELIDFLCVKAKELGYRELSLGVFESNAPAIYLYMKKGFNTLINETMEKEGKFYKLVKEL
ncbi:GNAT family N-acetyltransferase [Mobilisporobacter senegalensis]|uniref:GNAT family N-acetyltransferase n=1 Tax=Mobilisporobacter senegalensis TaxID=1329262 RepID=UPI000F4A65BF